MGQQHPSISSLTTSPTSYIPPNSHLHHLNPKTIMISPYRAQIYLELQCRTNELICQIVRYYQKRKQREGKGVGRIQGVQVVDDRGNKVPFADGMGSARNRQEGCVGRSVSTMCNLSFLNTNNNTTTNTVTYHLQLTHHFISTTLHDLTQTRLATHLHITETQLWSLLEQILEAATKMLEQGFKQPVLSPRSIKWEQQGWVVGQWEFMHYFVQGEGVVEREEEEGQTVVHGLNSNDQPQHIITAQQQYSMLTHYYWPPQGTTAMTTLTNPGRLTSTTTIQPNSQLFSLGMTLLQLLLQRPLYQSSTYSQKMIRGYMEEAVMRRREMKMGMSKQFQIVLRQLLVWDWKERKGYRQIYQIVMSNRPKTARIVVHSQHNSNITYINKDSAVSNIKASSRRAKIFPTTHNHNSSSSSSLDQQILQQQSTLQRPGATMRILQHPQNSLDYDKLDYTIRLQRKQWEQFQHRISTCPSINNITQPYHEGEMLEAMEVDREDCGNEQSMVQYGQGYGAGQQEVIDEEGESEIQYEEMEEIKLLDISNIKASGHRSNSKPKPYLGGQRQQQSIAIIKRSPSAISSSHGLLFHTESDQSFSTMLHGKNINVQAFMNESDSLLLKSSRPVPHKQPLKASMTNSLSSHSQLFTSPQLMALIRTHNPTNHQNPSSSSRLRKHLPHQLPPPLYQKPQNFLLQCSSSSYVRQQYAKGWYQGGKRANMRQGYGTFYYTQGGKYCGDWHKNQMHGQGTLYYANKNIAYQGQWKFDGLDGYGILYNQQPKILRKKFDYCNFDKSQQIWVSYEGHFKDDDKNGYGVLILSNGEKFEGEFRNDRINGEGKYWNMDGEVICGIWKDNKIVERIDKDDMDGNGKERKSYGRQVRNRWFEEGSVGQE